MKRREFLKFVAITTGTLAVLGTGSYFYLDNEKMRRAPKKQGKLIADLHTHPGRDHCIDEISNLLSWGITGLSHINENPNILTYDDILNLPNVTEIDKGLLAKIEYNGNKGYAAKTQEILSDHHILAVGCKEYIPSFEDARKVVEEIHKRGGKAILNHPYVIPTDSWPIKYRLINETEEKKVRELADIVDEIEVHNAQNINLIPFIAWMKQANEKAKDRLINETEEKKVRELADMLAKAYNKKGTASSDAHDEYEQIKICGIYVPEKNICIDALKQYIATHNFERYDNYVSRASFLKGHFF